MPEPSPSYPLPHPGNLVAVDGPMLPLVATTVSVDAGGGVARTVLQQRFRNPHDLPLAVTYSLPLPADAALSGFVFQTGRRRIAGEIEPCAAARERFEEAILEGRQAAWLEQDRSSVFTQEIANAVPGEEVIAELTIDQRLRWLHEGEWEWRFPLTLAPRYLGVSGRVADAGRMAQDVAAKAMPHRASLALVVRDELVPGRHPESPSHRIRVDHSRVSLHDEAGATLDRDLVVRWPVSGAALAMRVDVARPPEGSPLGHDAFALLTLVPHRPPPSAISIARDLVVLLDTSGSMTGEPLDHARRIVRALVDTLRGSDQLELIEFSDRPSRWKPEPMAATDLNRHDALAWLAARQASGGTEMREAIEEALRPLRGRSQRQVVLVTDGHIGFESEIVAKIASGLPPSSRVHAVGVGSAVNRTLTRSVSRAGRGAEVLAGLGEDPEGAASRIVAATAAPVLVNVSVGGPALLEHRPAKLPDVFAGAPLLVSLRIRAEGGKILVGGQTPVGPWQAERTIPAAQPACGSPAIVSLFGREAVEDLEAEFVEGTDSRSAFIEYLGLTFQIATRLTSWVAVAEELCVDPGRELKRVRIPHELPHGMSVEGLGLRGTRRDRVQIASMGRASGIERVDLRASFEDLVEGTTRVTTVTAATGAPSADDARAAQLASDCLVVVYTKEQRLLGRRFTLDTSPVRIGRDAANYIVLEGDSISRRHAHLEQRGDAWWCVDDASTNGSYVNDERILPEARLASGARIKIGPAILKFLSGQDVEAQYHEEIYRMTIIDGLTQIYVKRYLLEALDKEVMRARRHRRPLSFLMLDIDDFKIINDSHGHLAGDHVLKKLALLMQRRVRQSETLARFGGDEFAVILPETDLEGARSVAMGIADQAANSNLVFEGRSIHISLSIGGSLFKDTDAGSMDIILRADANLLEAKRNGRNRVIL